MKKISIGIMTALLASPSMAQVNPFGTDAVTDNRSNAFYVSPKIGLAMTSMTQPDECKLYNGVGTGIAAGIQAKIRFGKATEYSAAGTGAFGIALDLLIKQNKVKTTGTDEGGSAKANLALSYLEIPVSVQYYPFAKTAALNAFYVEAGAALALNMSRSPKSLTVESPSPEVAGITYHIDDSKSTLKASDFRPLIGIGYTLPNMGLGINARYYIGTSNMASNFPCKMSHTELTLSWQFNAGKF